LTGEGKQHSIATTEIPKAIEKLGLEEQAQLWTCFQEAEEIDELVAGVQNRGHSRQSFVKQSLPHRYQITDTG
jgi:hypothetical protein